MVQTSDDVKLVQSAVRKMLQFKNDILGLDIPYTFAQRVTRERKQQFSHYEEKRLELWQNIYDSDTFPLFHLRRICGFTEQLTGSRTSTHVKSAEKNRAGTRRDGGPV
ncbi:hypothetical protein RB195_002187 [Necator americanus]|uniref:Uncharacterized protein n=1 Tax=Necator americanus TaxID=51031 RepID=A0ABR1DHT6_NECAM